MTNLGQSAVSYVGSPALQRAQARLLACRSGNGTFSWSDAVQGFEPTILDAEEDEPPSFDKQTITLFPSLMMAVLRAEKSAVSRIYLLLQHLDTKGQGWISIQTARTELTKKESPLKVCGWRQLRNLLAEGQGLFWERDKTRIWLKSVAKVAFGLGVERFAGNPVRLPVADLLGGIGSVRAHFYASFHSSRGENGSEKPISRETLSELSGLSRQTQVAHERRAKIQAKKNIAVGRGVKTADSQTMHAKHGHNLFKLTDTKGQFGKAGAQYYAWQLPNSYVGTHESRGRGCQKRHNRTLRDLSLKGMTGNGQDMIVASRATTRDCPYRKVFYGDGKSAVKSQTNAYWLNKRKSGGNCWLSID